MGPSILIISPVRNEAAHIERVVRAVAAQELPPAHWIVTDDRSDDATLAILRRLEPEVPFLTVQTAGGKNGRALSHDGVNGYGSIPDAPSLDLISGMTLQACRSKRIRGATP